MTLIKSIRSVDLDLPPSCIAFAPAPLSDYFVVGTYHLHSEPSDKDSGHGAANETAHDGAEDDAAPAATKATANLAGGDEARRQKRTGSLILYRITDHGSNISLVWTGQLDSAVLDIQWNPHSNGRGAVLAVATSTGTIQVHRLEEQSPILQRVGGGGGGGGGSSSSRLKHLVTMRVCDRDTLVLSCQWHPTSEHVLGVSLSDGRVCICRSDDATTKSLWTGTAKKDEEDEEEVSEEEREVVALQEDVQQHELEAWTLAFVPSGHAMLSGGDDLALRHATLSPSPSPSLKDHDTMSPSIPPSSTSTIWLDRKIHQAGVTAILPLSDRLVLTGSYDEHIRLLAMSPSRRPKVSLLAESRLGGGVWRLKLLATEGGSRRWPPPPPQQQQQQQRELRTSPQARSFVILASCMHAGTRVVRLKATTPWTTTARNRSVAGAVAASGICEAAVGSLAVAGTGAGAGAGTDTGTGAAVDDDDDAVVWEFDLLARFEEHQSMNYGSDVWSGGGGGGGGEYGGMTVVSTSFYDRLMCLWRIDVDDAPARDDGGGGR